MSSVYEINKGVNRPIVFSGLKGQWIWWLGIGLLVLLLLFTVLYMAGVPAIIGLLLVFVLGVLLFWWVNKMSRLYGEHGWMKKMAGNYIPDSIQCNALFR